MDVTKSYEEVRWVIAPILHRWRLDCRRDSQGGRCIRSDRSAGEQCRLSGAGRVRRDRSGKLRVADEDQLLERGSIVELVMTVN